MLLVALTKWLLSLLLQSYSINILILIFNPSQKNQTKNNPQQSNNLSYILNYLYLLH